MVENLCRDCVKKNAFVPRAKQKDTLHQKQAKAPVIAIPSLSVALLLLRSTT